MSKTPKWATVPHTDIEPGVEVRLNEDGTVDEIIWEDIDGFHLEQMDGGQYWIGLTRKVGDERQMQHIILTRSGKFIYPTLYR